MEGVGVTTSRFLHPTHPSRFPYLSLHTLLFLSPVNQETQNTAYSFFSPRANFPLYVLQKTQKTLTASVCKSNNILDSYQFESILTH